MFSRKEGAKKRKKGRPSMLKENEVITAEKMVE